MSLDLSSLALYTRTGPAANISVYAKPYKPSSDEFLCCSDAGWLEHEMVDLPGSAKSV